MVRTFSGRRSRRVIAASVTAAATVTLGLTPAAAARPHAPGWLTLSRGSVSTTATTPSIARFGHRYEVIWVARTGASSYDIEARKLNAAGKPVGHVITALGGWVSIQGDPAIFSVGGVRVIAFGGAETGSPGSYDNGAEYSLTSPDGKQWTLGTGSLSAADHADRAAGTAVVNANGTVITGLAENGGVRYHVGASPSDPAPGPDPITASTGNSSAPGLGVDARSGAVWAVWYADGTNPHSNGVNAQVIYPSRGPRVHAPGSATRHGKSFAVPQDLSAAARTRGGVYTAYATPDDTAIDVWRLGATKPAARVNVTTYGAGSIVLTPARHGRLWLYWRDRNGWRASLSNRAVTQFGRLRPIPIPKHETQNIRIAGLGTAGPLAAIATVTTSKDANKIVARQIPAKQAQHHTR